MSAAQSLTDAENLEPPRKVTASTDDEIRTLQFALRTDEPGQVVPRENEAELILVLPLDDFEELPVFEVTSLSIAAVRDQLGSPEMDRMVRARLAASEESPKQLVPAVTSGAHRSSPPPPQAD